ncbi:hypothetical protein JXC34_03410, partial [Candidatus Woesearchaeota archaeon]|nr:hypothetical protein [Candidatus Woesearchaeota archaeon]
YVPLIRNWIGVVRLETFEPGCNCGMSWETQFYRLNKECIDAVAKAYGALEANLQCLSTEKLSVMRPSQMRRLSYPLV